MEKANQFMKITVSVQLNSNALPDIYEKLSETVVMS